MLRARRNVLGMGLMGVGGLIAVTGGLLFIVVCLRAVASVVAVAGSSMGLMSD